MNVKELPRTSHWSVDNVIVPAFVSCPDLCCAVLYTYLRPTAVCLRCDGYVVYQAKIHAPPHILALTRTAGLTWHSKSMTIRSEVTLIQWTGLGTCIAFSTCYFMLSCHTIQKCIHNSRGIDFHMLAQFSRHDICLAYNHDIGMIMSMHGCAVRVHGKEQSNECSMCIGIFIESRHTLPGATM